MVKTLSGKKLSKMVSILAKESEIRGSDATGIAHLHKEKISIYKRPIPANSIKFRILNDCHVVMVHTRLTTQGS